MSGTGQQDPAQRYALEDTDRHDGCSTIKGVSYLDSSFPVPDVKCSQTTVICSDHETGGHLFSVCVDARQRKNSINAA